MSNFADRTFCAAWWLSRMHADAYVLPAASRVSYRASSRSKHSSRAPSHRTAWNKSSGSFVFWEVHPIAVSPLSTTPHTSYPPPHHAAAEPATAGRQDRWVRMTNEDALRREQQDLWLPWWTSLTLLCP
jgi:hypothetical protein